MELLVLDAQKNWRASMPVNIDLRVIDSIGHTVFVANLITAHKEIAIGRRFASQITADVLYTVTFDDKAAQLIQPPDCLCHEIERAIPPR